MTALTRRLLNEASRTGPNFAMYLEELQADGTLVAFLPEVHYMTLCPQEAKYHPEGNVFEHTLAALYQNSEPCVYINVATLLHDIGKLTTYSFDGTHRYNGHAEQSEVPIRSLACRIGLPNDVRDASIFAAVNHMRLGTIRRRKKLALLVGHKYWSVLYAVFVADKASRLDAYRPDDVERVLTNAQRQYKLWVDQGESNELFS